MSARTIRRAAERQAAKLAAKAAVSQSQTTTTTTAVEQQEQPLTATASAGASTFGFSPISDAKLNANRENAKHSTGPTTPEGRAKSSMNAVKTGLTGRTVLLPSEDAAAYQQHLDRHVKKFVPTNDDEKSLVQSIADTEWRLLRIVPLEASIWAVARLKMADLYPEITDPTQRQSLIDGEIQLAYRKDLSNLTLQERRLRNQLTADTAQLEKLRADAIQKRKADFEAGILLYKRTKKNNLPFNPAFFGFVFTNEEMEAYLTRQDAAAFANGSYSTLTRDQFVALMAS